MSNPHRLLSISSRIRACWTMKKIAVRSDDGLIVSFIVLMVGSSIVLLAFGMIAGFVVPSDFHRNKSQMADVAVSIVFDQ